MTRRAHATLAHPEPALEGARPGPSPSTAASSASFSGLSGEQVLLATLVKQNPTAEAQVRRRAQILLHLHHGRDVSETARLTGGDRRLVQDLIARFAHGGLCEALLGIHASPEQRVWLNLTPTQPPRVRLQSRVATTAQKSTAALPA